MSRVCKDLDSPIEDSLIICGAITFVALCAFGIIYAVRWASYNIQNSQKYNPSVISEEPGGSNQVLPEAAPDNEEQQGNNSDDSMEVLEPDGTPHFVVSHVRDGDTIEVLYGDNQAQAIRLIGVDTPETVHPEKPIECFGPEASDYTKQKLLGRDVGVELDSSQGDYDSYNRILAYVYLDGENFNLDLIKNGYGYEYTYNTAYKYQKEFKEAEGYAMTRGLGLWSSCENMLPANISAY